FVSVVSLLTDDYTVVTYDPSGISRSPRDESEEDVLVETQADDASRLLAAVTAQPAYVFGNSGGAVTALALLSRHRDQISRQLAHRTTVALADQLGTSVVDFPGGHVGFTSHPEAFARVLRDALADEG